VHVALMRSGGDCSCALGGTGDDWFSDKLDRLASSACAIALVQCPTVGQQKIISPVEKSSLISMNTHLNGLLLPDWEGRAIA
jgi:hypothetical protein